MSGKPHSKVAPKALRTCTGTSGGSPTLYSAVFGTVAVRSERLLRPTQPHVSQPHGRQRLQNAAVNGLQQLLYWVYRLRFLHMQDAMQELDDSRPLRS